MEPLTIALAAGAAALLLSKPEASKVYAGGTRITLTPGNYRVKFVIAPVDSGATPLSNLFAMPQMTLGGLGLVSYFTGLEIDPKNAAAGWTISAVSQYAGPAKQVDLLPGMSLVRVP
jgi:hypothetical protein